MSYRYSGIQVVMRKNTRECYGIRVAILGYFNLDLDFL